MISKRHAQGVQHLIGMLYPHHPDTYQLVRSRAQEVVSDLADLSSAALGTGLDGVQLLGEWEHRPGTIVIWLTAHETDSGTLARAIGAHLNEEDAREQAEAEAKADCEKGSVFSWGPVQSDDPHGPQALFTDPPEAEEYPTGYQVHRATTRLA